MPFRLSALFRLIVLALSCAIATPGFAQGADGDATATSDDASRHLQQLKETFNRAVAAGRMPEAFAAADARMRYLSSPAATKSGYISSLDWEIAAYNRAAALERLGRQEEALADLDKWLEINPPVLVLAGFVDRKNTFTTGASHEVLRMVVRLKTSLMMSLGRPDWRDFLASSIERFQFEKQNPRVIQSSEMLSNAMRLYIQAKDFDRAEAVCRRRVLFHARGDVGQRVPVAMFEPMVFQDGHFIGDWGIPVASRDERNGYAWAESHDNCGDLYTAQIKYARAVAEYDRAVELSIKAAPGIRPVLVAADQEKAAVLVFALNDVDGAARRLRASFEAAALPNDWGVTRQTHCENVRAPSKGIMPGLPASEKTWLSHPRIKAVLDSFGCRG